MKKKVVVIIAVVVALAFVAYLVLPSLLLRWATDSERKTAGLQQKTALIGDHEIEYLEGGRGEAIIMVYGFHEALEPDLPKVKARTLVLWGDQDRVLDVSSALILKNGLPDSTTVIMKDCGHLPMIERPQETAEHYLAFLKGK